MDLEDRERVRQKAEDGPQTARHNVERAVIRAGYLGQDESWLKLAEGDADLEQGMILLNRTGDTPAVDIGPKLDDLAREIGDRLSGDRAFDVGLTVVGEVLSRVHGLAGNENDYYAPSNSYLSSVLETRRGIPISLCAVAMLIGRRLELPIHGIGAPGHFLGFYGDAELRLGSFFDPFDGYRRLTSGELRSLLAPFTESIDPGMLKPVGDREILLRVLRNLIAAYGRVQEDEHVRNLERWQQIISP